MRYFVIGFKNSGKTTFGRQLAERMGLGFVDLDEKIEEQEGQSIPEIYTRVGEDAFRKLEWKALKDLMVKDDIIVSTGGGAPCHCDNMSLMEEHGDVIYLKVTDETLISRLKKAVKDRPIVKGKTENELRSYVMNMRERCEHHYKRARYTIDGENINLDNLIRQLKDSPPE